MKKLKLNRDTIRALTAKQLDLAAGGRLSSGGDTECMATQIGCVTAACTDYGACADSVNVHCPLG